MTITWWKRKKKEQVLNRCNSQSVPQWKDAGELFTFLFNIKHSISFFLSSAQQITN